MCENNSVKNILLPCLHALRSQRPDKPMAQVRWAWAEISAALSAGHTLKAIHQRLCQDGVEIAYSTLARYINRVRCERVRQLALFLAIKDTPHSRHKPLPGQGKIRWQAP